MPDLAIDNNIVNCIFHLKQIALQPEDGSVRGSRNM